MKKDKNIETEVDGNGVENNSVSEKESPKAKAPKITKVGAMLKEVRLQKGLKIVDISRKLCIRKCYLEAIEESSYKDIPLFPYGIGFIRSYAKFLGLNDQNIVDLYKEETQSQPSTEIKELTPQTEASIPGIQYLLISLLAIVLIYVGWVLFNNVSEKNYTEETTEQSTQTDDTQLVVAEETDVENIVTEPALPQENNEQIVISSGEYVEEVKEEDTKDNASEEETTKEEKTTLTIPETGVFIEVLKETWVEVKDDTKLYLSKVLAPNTTYTINDANGKILSVGKHDGVNVYINGKKTNIFTINKKTNVALDKFLNNL